ncbi:GGDEF domain-containing protein [Congregibacter variabilis]|uniref:diguanylate cyclase n=1 Tax=Congregibacter variabilis TaxID=3081200 RepID=A0ABZ0I1I1_9GAMM|nr:GGDEF domain-containing protein [Congregibacter sp. IMCC43200]
MSEKRQQHKLLERQLMRLYQHHGLIGAVILVTVCSVVTSVAITMAVCWPLYAGSEGYVQGLAIPLLLAIVVPSICAPAATLVLVCLMQRLEEAVEAATRLATTDVLTGVANRRGFFQSIERLDIDFPDATTCLVGILDCDRFKQLNDSLGHAAGDAALIELARRLQSAVERHGCVGRLGGDEFGFVVTGSDTLVRNRECEIEEQCQRFTMDVPESKHSVMLHSSIGAVMQNQEETIEQALARADRQLYATKSSNREQSVRVAGRVV